MKRTRTFTLGVFTIGCLAILAAGIFLIGRKQFQFSSTYHVNANFPSVTGLSEGADVRVGGLHVGTVDAIRLPNRPNGKIDVEMSLLTSTKKIVRQDSTASIKTEGLLGDKYVEISFGSANSPEPVNGQTIAGVRPLELSDLIKKMDGILNSSQSAVDDLTKTSSNVKSITAKIDQGEGSAGALVNDRTIYNKAAEGVSAFADDMEALKHNFLIRGFFKNRGYEDSTELTKYRIEGLPSAEPAEKFSFEGKQLFDKPDGSKLKKHPPLADVGTFLERNPFDLAVIASSAGMKGDSDEKKKLTEAQAAVIREYLANNFRFDDSKLRTMGRGKQNQPKDGTIIEIRVYVNSGTIRTHAQTRP